MNDLFWPLIWGFATLEIGNLSNVPIRVFHRLVETRSMSRPTMTDPEANCLNSTCGQEEPLARPPK